MTRTLDEVTTEELTAVQVEVFNPETPFGGVQVFGVSDAPIQIVLREGAQGEPGPPGPVGPAGETPDAPTPGLQITRQGITPLVSGQSFVSVFFPGESLAAADWLFVECQVVNTDDPTPLNIWPGILTVKDASGFTLQLNGLPDSSNYFLHWAISGTTLPSTPATDYALSGPSSGGSGVASTDFTVILGGTVASPVTVTPSAGGGGGTFTPASVTLTTATPSATFTYTPASTGVKTISTTNDGGLSDPTSLSYTSFSLTDAHAYTMTGPSTGPSGTPSTNFTVALSGGTTLPAPVTITPSSGGGGGTFTPATVTLSTGTVSATFTYTPASTGAKTISVTNDGGLTDPANLTYTATAPAIADGDPVSSWPDSSGNGHDATQTGSARPIYKTAQINGKPAVRFTAAGLSGLNIAIPISGVGPWTMFAVIKGASAGATIRSLVSNTGSGPYGVVSIGTGSDLAALSTRTEAAYFTPNPYITGWHIYQGDITAGSGGLYVDGGPISSTPFAVTAPGDLDTLGGSTVAAVYSDGDIAEIFIYSAVLLRLNPRTIAERNSLCQYLLNKYAITPVGGWTPTSPILPTAVSGLIAWWKADAIT